MNSWGTRPSLKPPELPSNPHYFNHRLGVLTALVPLRHRRFQEVSAAFIGNARAARLRPAGYKKHVSEHEADQKLAEVTCFITKFSTFCASDTFASARRLARNSHV